MQNAIAKGFRKAEVYYMIKTVTGNINTADVKNVLVHEHIQCVSNEMFIYSDFPSRKQNGMNLTVEKQSENFGFIFKQLLPLFVSVGGSDEYITKMVRDNVLKVLDI